MQFAEHKKKNSQFFEKQKAKNTFFCVLNPKKQISGIYDCRMEVLFLLYSIFPTIFVQFFTTPYVPYIFSLIKTKYPLRVRFVTSKEMKLKLFF